MPIDSFGLRKSKQASTADPSPVDFEVFQQILELDDEDGHEFSMGMVSDFFSQAKHTFSDMDKALCVVTVSEIFISHPDVQ
jgi:hypothetical protein